jgi:hypothetical protein
MLVIRIMSTYFELASDEKPVALDTSSIKKSKVRGGEGGRASELEVRVSC